MKIKTETCTGTLHRDAGGWYAKTQLVGKAYLDRNLQNRPSPNLADAIEIEVTLSGVGQTWTVTDHFL